MTTLKFELMAQKIAAPGRDINPLLSLGLPLALSLALALYGLGQGEAHVDVYQVQGVFRQSWGQILRDFLTAEGLYGGIQAPLYFLLAKAYGSLFGAGLLQLRLLSVIALAGLVLLSWIAYPLITHSRRSLPRFLLALLVGTAPAHLWWAQTAKYTMWFYFVCALSLVAGLAYISKRKTNRLIAFIVCVAAMVYTHYFGFLLGAAQFCMLGWLAFWQRDKKWFFQLLGAGLVLAGPVAPLLGMMFQAGMLNLAEPGQYLAAPELSLPGLIRGFLLDLNFGYSLTATHGAVAQATGAIHALSTGQVRTVFGLLRPGLGLVLAAALVLGVGLCHAAYSVRKHGPARANLIYLAGVPLLALGFSQFSHLSFRFSYLGIGTWCTLACLATGWAHSRRLTLPLFIVGGMLLLYAISLATYYQKLDYKYPGAGLVVEYLQAHPADFDVAYIDAWIIHDRGTPLAVDQLPAGVKVMEVNSWSELAGDTPAGARVVAFLAGRQDEVAAGLDRLQAGDPRISWTLLESWESLEQAERSIQVVRLKAKHRGS